VSRNPTGTLAWARATGGALDRRARFEQLRHAVLARLAAMGPDRRRRAGLSGSLELPQREPDSELCRAALELCRETSSDALVGHCLRTWIFAALFASRDGIAHDEEALYVACLLHDLGLTPSHWQRDERARCFAVEGAFAAERFCLDCGQPPGRAEQIAEAIVCHLNVRVPLECGPETRLLHAGVGLDAVGRRAAELGSGAVAEVLARHPRTGMVDELAELTAAQAELRPESRMGLLTRLGFQGLVRANPLDR
jgi:HD domain